MSKKMRGNIMLLITAAIWGSAFVAQKSGMDHVGPFLFNGTRLLIAVITLTPVIAFFDAQRRKEEGYTEPTAEDKKKTRRLVMIGGGIVGAVLFAASSFQQVGMVWTTAGKAGFVTALYMVLVPILSIALGKVPRVITWLCVALGAVGLFLLCVPADEGFSGINKGDIIMLGSALCFALHILVIDHFSPMMDGVRLSRMQFLTAGVLSIIAVLLGFDARAGYSFDFQALLACAVPLLYSGVLSAGVGYTLQIIAQKDTDPTVASLLMSLESVFAVISGAIILGEQMGLREIVGCVLMFAAIIIIQLPDKKKE